MYHFLAHLSLPPKITCSEPAAHQCYCGVVFSTFAPIGCVWLWQGRLPSFQARRNAAERRETKDLNFMI